MEKQNKLHIGLVGPLPPPYGGMANQTRQLLTLLEAEGIQVSFVQTNPVYKPRIIEKYPKIRALFRLLPYIISLWKLAGSVQVIHVLANSGWSWQLFAAPVIWIGKLRNTPVIVNYRGGEAKFYFEKAIKRVRPTILRGNALVVPSKYLQKVFAEFDLTAEVIPNIIDLERFKPKEKTISVVTKTKRIIVTRNLETIYDIPTAIRAISILQASIPDIELYIAGSGPQEKELKELVKRLNLKNAVTFTGKISPDEMAELYQSADIMLNPTTVDNMPNSVLESMGSCVPVVTTNVGGIPYIVKDEETALLVEPGDEKSMAQQLERLLLDPALYQRLASNGLKEVQQYTWPLIKDKWLSSYQRIANVDIRKSDQPPKLLVFSSLFPHANAPNNGVFIRERMFRVGKNLPITVVSPQPWFPGQSLIRAFRPNFRSPAMNNETQQGVDIRYPKFFSIPLFFKELDGLFMALGSYRSLRQIQKSSGFDVIDSHFAYPDGYAAVMLGRWLRKPVVITLRGTEVPLSRMRFRRGLMVKSCQRADHIFSVSDSLKQHIVSLGVKEDKIKVVGNGVDLIKFSPVPKKTARQELALADSDKVLISVGGLVERKGFHRVIELLPPLLVKYPNLKFLIVGGPGPEGDWSDRLHQQVKSLELDDVVRFLGMMPSTDLKVPLSAADVFVLATSNEGWANVFLEAMACGLPVVTTDVGGNREVVCRDELGTVVPFGDAIQLESALNDALAREWDTARILSYAGMNSWDSRVKLLCEEFVKLGKNGN